MAQTTLDALKSINAYPVPLRTIMETAERRALSITAEAAQEVLQSKAFRLAKADLLLWLSLAPDITQGGQSFGFTDEQRKQMRREAQSIYEQLEPTAAATTGTATFGYKGSRL